MEIFDIQLCVSVRRNISTHEFLCLCSTEYFDTWVFVFVFSGILVFIKTIMWANRVVWKKKRHVWSRPTNNPHHIPCHQLCFNLKKKLARRYVSNMLNDNRVEHENKIMCHYMWHGMWQMVVDRVHKLNIFQNNLFIF